MKQEILVLYARPFSIEQENGSKFEGTSVCYIDPLTKSNDPNEGLGHMVVKTSISKDIVIAQVPAIYSAGFLVKNTSKGAQLKINELNFISTVDMLSLWGKK